MDILFTPLLAFTFFGMIKDDEPYEHIEIEGLGHLDFDNLEESIEQKAELLSFFLLVEVIRLDMVSTECGGLENQDAELSELFRLYRKAITELMSYTYEFYSDKNPTYDKTATRIDAARKLSTVVELSEAFALMAKEALAFEPGEKKRVFDNLDAVPRLLEQDKDFMEQVRLLAQCYKWEFLPYWEWLLENAKQGS